jgi:hypothetical protein
MTEMRVPSWQSLFSLYDVAMARRLDPTNTPARSWLSDTNITSKLGNAATELTLASPRELRASRSSALGFTGVELVALARWLENRAFPAYQPPDLLPIFKRALAPSPAAPAPR